MTFEFKADECLRKGIRRISRKQLKNALELITESTSQSVDEAVHDVRRSLKRLRAVLRMVRPAIGQSAFRFENESFREAGRPLAEVRDANILVKALDKLAVHFGDVADADSFAAARKELVSHHRQVCKHVLIDQGALESVESTIRKALKRVDDWSDVPNRWRKLGEGVKGVYASGRKAFDDVKAVASVEHLHEWRKHVKYLRHALELLTPLRPDVLAPLARKSEKLGKLLGDDHDLAVLKQMLLVDIQEHSDDTDPNSPVALIDRRREEIQAAAFPCGELLYRERPKQFADRLRRYWKAWRQRDSKRQAGKRRRTRRR